MSQCIVPNWNLRHQRQEQVEGEERNRSPHVQSEQNLSYVVPMSNNEVTELTWVNGQLSLHGLGGILPPQTKQTWAKPGDSTLESLVHQATNFNNFPQHARGVELKYSPSMPTSSGGKWGEDSNQIMEHNQEVNLSSIAAAASSGGKWRENTSHMQVEQNGANIPLTCGGKWRDNSKVNSINNPTSSCGKWRENLGHQLEMDEEKAGVKLSSNIGASSGGKWGENSSPGLVMNKRKSFQVEESACASASATFCRDTDTTMMTWASFESPRSLKTARNTDDDSVYHDCSENQDGDRIIKEESFRSQSSARRSRAAAVHNQSERRRRDRINEKMKALQKLVPNASKTDKASMLDEVIEYLKQLQAQVHMMSNARNMPQIVMPLGMQQQLQMSLLARMGMGMGMGMGIGMIDVNNLARNMPHSFPPLIHAAAPLGGTTPSFVSPPFAMPQVVPHPMPLKANVDATTINTSVPNFNDAYNTFLAQQSMNMDFLNKMSALYRQQGSQQASKKPVSLSLPNDVQGQ